MDSYVVAPIGIRKTNRVQTHGIGTARAADAHGEEADEGVYERKTCNSQDCAAARLQQR
jgi:hypothetical protein